VLITILIRFWPNDTEEDNAEERGIHMQWESEMFASTGARQPPELRHYGIKGQRWGQRRFQEEDGTYTAAGKERYGRVSGKASGRKTKGTGDDRAEAQKRQNGKKRDEWKAKDVSELSDEELRRRNNRLQAEQNYKNNMTSQRKKDAKNFVKNNVQEAVKNIFIGTAVTALAAVMAKNYKKAGPIIVKASKVAVSKIRSAVKTNSRNAIKNAVDRYSSARNNKTNREYDYRLGNRNGIRKSHNWPTIPAKEPKKKR